MQAGLTIFRSASPLSSDFELGISAADGDSHFTVKLYVVMSIIDQLMVEIRKIVDGGLCSEFQFGTFGPEFAGGAVSLRFARKGEQVYITVHLQKPYNAFNNVECAAEAKLYVLGSLLFLEKFVEQLAVFVAGDSLEAHMDAYAA